MAHAKRLSIGIVGAGEIVRRAHLPVLSNIADVSIDWIYDQRDDKARGLGNAYGIGVVHPSSPDQLPHCDVALLAIPVDARRPYLEHFSRAGSAVLCEKPFALGGAEHADYVNLYSSHALGCGLMRRFYRSTQLLRRLVKSKEFGGLTSIEIGEGNRSKGSGAEASFLDDPRLRASRGVLMDLGSHSLDLALYVLGATGFEVAACAKQLDGAVDRHVAAQVRLSNSASPEDPPVQLNYVVSWLERQTNRISLAFERAVVWSELGPSATVYLGDPSQPADCISLMRTGGGASTFNQAFYLQWRSFLDGIKSRSESAVSGRSAMLTTLLAENLLAFGEPHHV
jgi:predicted dehydrogenase